MQPISCLEGTTRQQETSKVQLLHPSVWIKAAIISSSHHLKGLTKSTRQATAAKIAIDAAEESVSRCFIGTIVTRSSLQPAYYSHHAPDTVQQRSDDPGMLHLHSSDPSKTSPL